MMAPRSALLRYLAAVLAVAAATALTTAVPLLRDRLTFFAFWPVILGVAWLAGPGPGIVSSILSAVAVLVVFAPYGFAGTVGLAMTLVVFVVAGASAALIARWRERSAAELRESRDLFRTAASSAPVFIWVADPRGERTFFNDPWLEFTGSRLEREVGDRWLANVHPDDRERVRREHARGVAERQPFSLEYRVRRRDGAWRFVLERGVPRSEPDGRLAGWVGSAVDVTEQRLALERAEAALERAEQASRAKDAFLATVSHELRTPLSPILAWARMLQKGVLTAEQESRAVEVIERNAKIQAQLVEDLLDVSRIVEGRLRMEVRPVALGKVVEAAVETVRSAADARGVQLDVAIDVAAPLVQGDPDRLQQVVWNLLSNAVKFTPRDGRVGVELAYDGSHVVVKVSDTGQGIAAEQLPHLFERFWQADPSPSRKHGGLGLGLAIVRHLVELHGGGVSADSPGDGAGSTFVVRLPVAPTAHRAPADPHSGGAKPMGKPWPPAARLDGVRVLLVDDEPDANEVVRLLLARQGAEVRVAASAAQALDILERWRPDVLLLDIGMPGEDGYQLIARLRARDDALAQIPAVALTAYAAPEDRARMVAAGFAMHVAKPAEPSEITSAVGAVAALRRSA